MLACESITNALYLVRPLACVYVSLSRPILCYIKLGVSSYRSGCSRGSSSRWLAARHLQRWSKQKTRQQLKFLSKIFFWEEDSQPKTRLFYSILIWGRHTYIVGIKRRRSMIVAHIPPIPLTLSCTQEHHLVSGWKTVVLRVPVIQRFQKGVGARVPKGGEGMTNITECRRQGRTGHW